MTAASGGDPPREGRRGHLTEAEARLLESLIADRPGATEGQILALFRARTGRRLNHTAVQMRRRPRPPGPGNGHLTEAEQALLAYLVRESAGEGSYREVARQFEAAAGRPIATQSVWRFAVEVLGMPRVGKGSGPGGRPAGVAARLAAASAAKRDAEAARLDRAKVDRSPRVGRTGRVLPGGPRP